MNSWPLPIYWSPDWLIETPPDIRAAVLERVDRSELDRHDAWLTVTPDLTFRSFRLPFYRDVLLVEFQVERPFGEGYFFGSYLVAPRSAGKTHTPDAEETPTYQIGELMGASPPIHEFNGTYTLTLDTVEQAIAYVTFFCAQVWGDEGGFWVCAGPAEIPWLPDASEEQKRAVENIIQAPQLTSSDENSWRLRATTLYGRRLFAVAFAIQRTGMIEMLEDNGLLPGLLDVVPDRRLLGYRTVPLHAPVAANALT